jgi:hypothetical protein
LLKEEAVRSYEPILKGNLSSKNMNAVHCLLKAQTMELKTLSSHRYTGRSSKISVIIDVVRIKKTTSCSECHRLLVK